VNDAFAYGSIVEIFNNGYLHFDSSCFIQNKAHGNGLVASYGEDLPTVVNTFGGANEVDYRAMLECEFVALVDGSDGSFPNIACADFEADTCDFITPSLEGESTSPLQGETDPSTTPPTEDPTSSAAFRFGCQVSIVIGAVIFAMV
jgi:hypothetical protein